jgi:hypothetical protein
MTCTLAITDSQIVLLAGDSAAVGGKELRLRADTKVFRTGSYGIGYTTSFRMGQILRYGTALPEPPPGLGPGELERFLITEVIPVIRRSFADHGFAKTARFSSSGDSSITEEGQDFGGLFLLGVAGQIFEIRQDYHLARPAAPFSAVGSGAPVALGALHALQSLPNLSLRDQAAMALAAAEAYNTGVRAPFHFVELPPAPALVLCKP